jgi:hypothetical protein
MLRRVGESRSILNSIRKRKLNRIGHILRRDCIKRRIMEEEIKGKTYLFKNSNILNLLTNLL